MGGMACPPCFGKTERGREPGHYYCAAVVRMERPDAWIGGGEGRAAESEAEDYGWNEFIHTAFPFFFGGWPSEVTGFSFFSGLSMNRSFLGHTSFHLVLQEIRRKVTKNFEAPNGHNRPSTAGPQ